MKRKRMASLLVLALLAVIALTGCSGGGDGKTGGASETPPAGGSTAASGEETAGGAGDSGNPLHVSMLLPGEGNHMGEDSLILQEIEKRSNTQIAVTLIPASDYNSRLNLLFASGEVPDLVVDQAPSGQLFSNQTFEAIKAGLFHDLTPYIEDPEFATKYPNLNYPKEMWDLIKFNGKIYGLPRSINQFAHSGIWIRKDLLDKAGLKEPATMDELADVMIKLSHAPDMYGMEFRSVFENSIGFAAMTTAFTGTLEWKVSDQGDFTYHAFTPEYKELLAWLKNLYDHKALDPEFALDQKNDLFGDGHSAVLFNTFFARPTYPNYKFFADSVPKDATTTLLEPIKGPHGWAVASFTGFSQPALLSSKFPEEDIPRFFELWNYLASDDKLELEQYGIEGVHYNVVDGVKTRTDKYKEDLVNSFETIGFNKAVDKVKLHTDAGAGPEITAKMYEVGEKNIELMKEMDLQFPTYGIEAPKFAANFGNVIKDLVDNRAKVIMGAMSMEDWDKYVQSVTASRDYQDIVAELKQAYLNKPK